MGNLTPLGVQDFVPSEAKAYQELLLRCIASFESGGYERIKTPSLEYMDVLRPGLGPHLESTGITLTDPQGQLLMLRCDNTASCARMVATRMADDELPLKLYYLDPVFRKPSFDTQDRMEIFQAGVEHIGESSYEADAEVIATGIQTLLALGVKDFKVDIGHVVFSQGLSDAERTALLDGDYLTLGYIPEHGGVETVEDYPYLCDVYRALDDQGFGDYVSFNKGLVKGLGYYTGLIFEFYVRGVSQIVASGGRYDQLLGRFGYDVPAVGLALNISVLREAGFDG